MRVGRIPPAFLSSANDASKTLKFSSRTARVRSSASIERYAFTTNNITYAVIGDTLGYWNFFPAEEPYGIVPVWGFANVISSKNENVSEGEKFYGYFPMSKYLKVIPKKVNTHGFIDDSNHRKKLPFVYNHYLKVIKNADESSLADVTNVKFIPLIALTLS